MIPAVIVTGWQVLGAAAALLLVLFVACVVLLCWASSAVIHDIYDEE